MEDETLEDEYPIDMTTHDDRIDLDDDWEDDD